MVTKRVIVPARLQPNPARDAAPANAAAETEPLLTPLDAGPPTMPLSAEPMRAEPMLEPHRGADLRDEETGPEPQRAASPRSAFWPLLLVAASWLTWMGFYAWQLANDRQALVTARDQLEQPMARSAKVRQLLDALATDTQRLADGGNPNARLLVDELRRRGVTIDPSAPAASVPK